MSINFNSKNQEILQKVLTFCYLKAGPKQSMIGNPINQLISIDACWALFIWSWVPETTLPIKTTLQSIYLEL